jgi:hypothetical protein
MVVLHLIKSRWAKLGSTNGIHLLFRLEPFRRCPLAEEKSTVPRPVRQYGGIDQFTAAGAFPGVKGSYEIVVFFCVHAASALGTVHTITSCLIVPVKLGIISDAVCVPRYWEKKPINYRRIYSFYVPNGYVKTKTQLHRVRQLFLSVCTSLHSEKRQRLDVARLCFFRLTPV